ncbi:uncharacterized protein LOC127286156 isoform X2 [Leptopilina boulardi]|uniref:uncharacterized protein LOC127286156 isoform X2 n=1 Tax=Leptopilina boulardi TaxID=63433 RepID=UPI0021F5A905|nr:uncharacterized protein LOC127286156 isoform X2 [Leptopilina boulardi]
MTMTSVAVIDQGSLPFNMLTPKRYHLQQGLAPNTSSTASNKNYDTLSKGKKSWSVRLGLSRQSQSSEDPVKGWGTISGGSSLSHQIIYGEPWIYGTVRASRSGHDPRAFLTPPPPTGAPILIVCSCPEFLSGTSRKLGNCTKCGGHRLAGIPFGGTCRIPTTSVRTRPSLAGILKPMDDPYDQMRRNRLVEPRSRTRSISPHRQNGHRDLRSQSVMRGESNQESSSSRLEWYNETDRQTLNDEWSSDSKNNRNTLGRFRGSKSRPTIDDWQMISTRKDENWKNTSNDSRRSILECNVNPYQLVKKNPKDEDDLSDDLSDNALEHCTKDDIPCSLFDSSKVKSIERIPNRSAVAAIGGQRIRVFNEPREISDEEDFPLTGIPIPKVSPKRPPRRLKETKTVLKSILKKGRFDGKRKNVLFNVDNVIFAPEKSLESNVSRRTSRTSIGSKEIDELENEPIVHEAQIIEKPKFITIPNIKDPGKHERRKVTEMKISSRVKNQEPVEKIKIDKFVPSKKLDNFQIKKIEKTNADVKIEIKKNILQSEMRKIEQNRVNSDKKIMKEKMEYIKPEDETELEIEIEELKRQLGDIAVDEKDLILKSEGTLRQSYLSRSQSDRMSSKSDISAGDINFVDTMRLSLSKKSKDTTLTNNSNEIKEEELIKEISKNKSPESIILKKSHEILNEDTIENQLIKNSNNLIENSIHFRKMRPTNWSPPPIKSKHINRDLIKTTISPDVKRNKSEEISSTILDNKKAIDKEKIEINSSLENNICKINVNTKLSPLVHRLQVGSNIPIGSRRTSILINGEQNVNNTGNKVTISVGGEDSVCNPTVISVNSDNLPKIQNSAENRTLVILENYKSNIVIESNSMEKKKKNNDSFVEKCKDGKNHNIESLDETICKTETKTDFNSTRWSSLSKESLISKLLEDSLRKARENGEILDESSGEAILKILKQSLLKTKEYESSESTLESDTNYRSSSLNSDNHFISSNLFIEENPYEIIKEPIYEEIPDEPPPLPMSPPPTEDYLKDRIYFGDEYKENYYKKNNQFLGFYLSDDMFKKSITNESYLSKSSDDYFKKSSTSSSPDEENLTTKFELFNFLMNSKDHNVPMEEDEDEEEEDEEDEEDTERDLEALYEQKETSLGDLSSKSSQISNVSDSSEECNIILTSSPETLKARSVDIERTDSGVGSESSQASSTRGIGCRRWRTGNTSSGPGSIITCLPQIASDNIKFCEDCEQRIDPHIIDNNAVYASFVCRKCLKKRAERKEIITEIVETEQKYGRDLQIILEEFHRPMLSAGLLTPEQLSAIFLNVEELLEHNLVLAEKLKDAVEFAQESEDEDLITVDVGKLFLESERMLHAFENYCTRQGSASLLLQSLEKEKELLRIFLKVSQMENTVLRRMNLNSFLMVPVQRVTKYPLLLARLLKATPSVRLDTQESRKRLKQAQTNIELHLEHMNAEAKDVTSTKLWRRISIIQGRRYIGEQDMVNIKLRKMAVEVLEWAHEEARFVLEGRLLIAQPTDNNWRRGRTVKLAPVTAMLVTNGKQTGIKEATLLLVKEKIGRYSLLREPLYLDKCIVCCEADLEDYFEIQELSSKETFIFKGEDGTRTKRWCRALQAYAQSLGAWRRRRGALPNIMICGVSRS